MELNRRPKLLFLARAFPPLRVTACVRTWNIAKYLSRLGWDITVVTPYPSLWRDVANQNETDAALDREGIRRILTDHQWRCLSPNNLRCRTDGVSWLLGGISRWIARRLGLEQTIGWIKPAEHSCATLTAKDVDVILATASPFATFRLARRLANKLECPYVMDYRDPWTGNPHVTRLPRLATIREEAALLARAAAVTIVSRSWGLALERRFGLGKKLHIVSNGYDPEELANIEPHDFGHFAIVYTGNFYPPKRNISPVMAALKRLKETIKDTGGDWYFHYYGRHGDHVRDEANRFGVTERVILHGVVPMPQALSAVRGAGVTVVITSVVEEASLEDKGVVTGKLFESLGLGKPCLLIAPPGSDVESIGEETGLIRCFAGSDISGVASFLRDAIQGLAPEVKRCQEYAWSNIAKRLDSVLRTAISASSSIPPSS